MSNTPTLSLVAALQKETGYWSEVFVNPEGVYLRLSNPERGIECSVTSLAAEKDVHIIFSVKGCANIDTYAPADNHDFINDCISQLFADANPSDTPFVLTDRQLEEMTDFTEGYGLTKPASLIMGKDLINAMVDHITKEGLFEDSCRIVRKDFNGIGKLDNIEETTNFFSVNYKLIKRWLKRQAIAEQKISNNTVVYAKNYLPIISDKNFSAKDIKAVLIDNNKSNPYYIDIADAITKETALALAKNYKNFSAFWIPF